MASKLKVVISLIQPVIATQVGAGEENSAISYDFIPGALIRGAAIGQYEADLESIEARDLFFNGQVRYLNAYICSVDQKARCIPTPKSWRIPKEKGSNKVYDFAVLESDIKQPKPLKSGKSYFLIKESDKHKGESSVVFSDVKMQIKVHNARTKRFEKQKGSSQVYRYEALAKEQTFISYVLGQESLLKTVKELLDGKRLLLGRSRQAGYGQVEVSCILEEEKVSTITKDKPLYLQLQSDLILRDEFGAFATNLDRFFQNACGQTPDATYVQMVTVGGFNRKWNLPLPQSCAIQAGSVLVFKKPTKLLIETVSQLNQTGIGERVVDGFGHFSITQNTFIESDFRLAKTIIPESKLITTEQGRELALGMLERIMRIRLDEILAQQVAALSIINISESSQLARIRLIALDIIDTEDYGSMEMFIASLRKDAIDKLTRARVILKTGDSDVVEGRLLSWLNEGNKIWENYFEGSSKLGNLKLANITAEISDSMKMEYIGRLIDGVLNKASKAIG